jgi:hypothetical protein
MVYQWAPDGELLDIQTIELVDVGQRKLEKGPLIALKIDPLCERQGSDGLETHGMQ